MPRVENTSHKTPKQILSGRVFAHGIFLVTLGFFVWVGFNVDDDAVYMSDSQLEDYDYPRFVSRWAEINDYSCSHYSYKPIEHDSNNQHLIVMVNCETTENTTFVARSIGGRRDITTSFACHQYNDSNDEYYDLQQSVIEFLEVDADVMCSEG